MDEQIEQISNHITSVPRYLQEQMPLMVMFGIRVVLSIVAFFVGVKLIRLIQKFIRVSLEKSKADRGVIQFVCSVSYFGLYALLIFNVAIGFGVKESSVAALLGTAGVTVGLALQGGLANVAGGVMLLLFKPFQIGDYIVQDVSNGYEGFVNKIEICYTTLVSMDNRYIVIPNGTLSNCTIINVTASDRRRLEIRIGISYNTDIKKAKDIMMQLLIEDPDIIINQDTQVFIDELTENAMILQCRTWVPTSKYLDAKWRLNERLKEAFEKNQIHIARNRVDVYTKTSQQN